MSSYIDLKYIMMVSPRLEKFKKVRDNLFNFRCPYCGDSQKSRSKARGYFYRKKNDFFFKCHNCGSGTNLSKVIQYIDSELYREYVLERYKADAPKTEHSIVSVKNGDSVEEVNSEYAEEQSYIKFRM